MTPAKEREVGRHGSFRAWVDQAGAVRIAWGSCEAVVRPEDRFELEFGGMSAAVGYVPISVAYWSAADGRRHWVLDDGVDEYITDEDPHALRETIASLLREVARQAGCTLIE